MHGIEVKLPGGLLKNGSIERLARFRQLTGRIEKNIIEIDMDCNRIEYVNAVLSHSLQSIGNCPVNNEHISALCIADRQYLMLRLSAMLDGEQMWLKISCNHCDSVFDIETKRCDLPVKEANEIFPDVTINLNSRMIKARIPNGADQQSIQNISDEQAMQTLLRRCVYSVDGETPDDAFFNSLTSSDIDTIDAALDESAPAVCNQLIVNCPECDQQQYANLDHYTVTGISEHNLYSDIHRLASHYHWSEEAILELPQSRRHLYLDLINRSTGMVT